MGVTNASSPAPSSPSSFVASFVSASWVSGKGGVLLLVKNGSQIREEQSIERGDMDKRLVKKEGD